MKQRRRIYYSAAQRSEIWDRWQAGEPMSAIGRRAEEHKRDPKNVGCCATICSEVAKAPGSWSPGLKGFNARGPLKGPPLKATIS
jgi:hypothetical protein